MRKQRVVLEDSADTAFVGFAFVDNFAFKENVAGGGQFKNQRSTAAWWFLPQPEGPSREKKLPCGTESGNTVQSALARKLFYQLAHFQNGLFHQVAKSSRETNR